VCHLGLTHLDGCKHCHELRDSCHQPRAKRPRLCCPEPPCSERKVRSPWPCRSQGPYDQPEPIGYAHDDAIPTAQVRQPDDRPTPATTQARWSGDRPNPLIIESNSGSCLLLSSLVLRRPRLLKHPFFPSSSSPSNNDCLSPHSATKFTSSLGLSLSLTPKDSSPDAPALP
jgi:hypothetical protein